MGGGRWGNKYSFRERERERENASTACISISLMLFRGRAGLYFMVQQDQLSTICITDQSNGRSFFHISIFNVLSPWLYKFIYLYKRLTICMHKRVLKIFSFFLEYVFHIWKVARPLVDLLSLQQPILYLHLLCYRTVGYHYQINIIQTGIRERWSWLE